MRLGCAAYSYRDALKSGEMTLEQFVVECQRMGLDGVELTSYYFSSTDRAYLNELKRHCFAHGMHILATAVGSNFTHPEEERRREQVELTRQWIDHSVVLGAPCLRVFAGSIPAGHTEVDALRWAVGCLRECIPYAAERGVVLALENHGGITATAQQVLRLAEELRNPWFGLNLDFGNFRNDPYHEFELCAAHAVTTHAKRTMRAGEGRVSVDYARVAEILRRSGYAGYISVEYEDAEDPRTAVPAFVTTLKQCFR
jgi:sugar phosphate isomerase/epimerase